jgi:hypothetical protein
VVPWIGATDLIVSWTSLRTTCRTGQAAWFGARGPRTRFFLRTLVALLLIIGGIAGIVLPVLGFWMVPLGVALLAVDVPFLRGPLGRLLAYINRKLASQAS